MSSSWILQQQGDPKSNRGTRVLLTFQRFFPFSVLSPKFSFGRKKHEGPLFQLGQKANQSHHRLIAKATVLKNQTLEIEIHRKHLKNSRQCLRHRVVGDLKVPWIFFWLQNPNKKNMSRITFKISK